MFALTECIAVSFSVSRNLVTMFQTGLLIVTRPVSWVRGQLPVYLSEINRLVSKTVYIHIQPDNNREPDQLYKYAQKVVPYTLEVRNLVKDFYSSSAAACSNLDIRMLLENVSNLEKTLGSYKLKNVCDLVMIDRSLSKETEQDVLAAVGSCFSLRAEASLLSLKLGSRAEDKAKKARLDDSQV